jgi:transposase
MAEGIEGLKDRPMPGAPPKVTKAYEEQLLSVVRRPRSLGQPYSMWTLQRLADYMAEQTGIRVSDETVRQLLKAGEIVLSRPQDAVVSSAVMLSGEQQWVRLNSFVCTIQFS